MTVSTIVQETIVDEVGSVVLSPIVQDPDTNLFIRTIQVFSPPDLAGNAAVQFTLRFSGATQANVELSSATAVLISAPSALL